MEKVLTVAEKRLAEQRAVSETGYTTDILIENAAAAFLRAVRLSPCERILVVAGGGNNGADALSVARMLFTDGYNVSYMTAGENPNENVRRRLGFCRALGVPVTDGLTDSNSPDVIIDGIFGTGLSRPLTDEYIFLINKINSTGARIISIDVPSGLNADTGRPEGASIRADITVALGSCSVGLLINDAPDYTGEIITVEIGIPAVSEMTLMTADDIKPQKRRRATHKYDYGKTVIIGGSATMQGAPKMTFAAARAALRGGAGLAVAALPDCLFNSFQTDTPEAMHEYLKSENGRIIYDESALTRLTEKASAVAVGIGMPPDESLMKIISHLAARFDGTLILDAGALTAMSENIAGLKNSRAKIILTPHAGEFERLTKTNKDLPIYERVRLLAAETGAVVLYKSAYSIISDGAKTVFSTAGTAAMAKGGTGDVLAGLIAARAHKASPFKAACESAYILGKAGEQAEKAQSAESVLATDIIQFLAKP